MKTAIIIFLLILFILVGFIVASLILIPDEEELEESMLDPSDKE
jgi:hypothetical protein